MKDKSKRLTVVNTGKKPSEKKEVQQIVVQPSLSSSSHAPGFNPNLYLLKSVWDSVFEIKTDGSGQKYIFGKLPVVTKYGITMYADDGNVDIPQLAEGLPFDQRTIWFNPETKQIEVIGGTGGGGEGGVSNFWDLSGIPSWITNTKPIYNYSEINGTPDLSVFVTGTALSNTLADYATLSYLTGELKKYVTLDGAQDIKGVKNFVNGLKIGGLPITKKQDDVIYIDANLVVRGGVTMFGTNEVDLPTIKDEIGIAGYNGATGLASFNSSQFSISPNGTVTIIGGSTGLDTAQLKDYLDSNKYTTETWVKEQGYASASSLSSLQTKVNNFLEGSDTDTIINKWKELEAFLSGLSESDNLAAILGTKANQSALDATNAILATKWTTDNNLINKWNTAYGWGDHSKVGYALKSYVDDTFVTIKGNENVTGVHDFVNGLKIGNIKLSKSQDGVLYLEGNLVVKGGVTMYALDEVTVDSIIDSLPLASTSQYGIAKFNPSNFVINEDGFVTIIGGSSGLDIEELAEYLATNKYVTQGWVEGKGYITSSALNGYATQSWVTNQKYITGITSVMVVSALGYTPFNNASFTKSNIKSTLGISDWALATSKPSYNFSEIGTKPTTLGGYGITDAKISNGVITLGSATITPLTTHQTIYNLTLQAGTFSAKTFDPNGSAQTVNIPTTTSHISEGNNLYFTNARAVSALTDTLKAYVTLSGTQTITGEKNFTGGLKVNNSPSIYYDATNKYWKLEGDLLVTGGVSMYSDDSEFTPSTIMDGVVVDGTSIRKNPTTGALEVIGGSGATVKYPLSWSGFNQGSYDGSVAQSFYIPTKLSEFVNDRSFITSSDLSGYLPLSGGTISNTHDQLIIKRLSDIGSAFIRYYNNEGHIGTIGIGGSKANYPYEPYFQNKNDSVYKIYHSGNDGAGSGLDADTLDGLDSSVFARQQYSNNFIVANNEFNFVPSGFTPSLWFNYSTLGGLNGNITDYYFGNGAGHIKNVTLHATTFSGNSASATKLQTARTIWGQNFDGTGNITDCLHITTDTKGSYTQGIRINQISSSNISSIWLATTNSAGYDAGMWGISATNTGNLRFRGGATDASDLMNITQSGNVLIGTTTDSGYKLNVNGNVVCSGEMRIVRSGAAKTYLNISMHDGNAEYNAFDHDDNFGSHTFKSNGEIVFRLNGYTKNVGVGFSNPTYKLDVNGDIHSTTNVRTPIATIDGISIYKSQDDVLYIDGNLVVRGGVTMYAENEVDIPSIIDSLPIASNTALGIASFDSTYFSVDSNGMVSLTSAPSSISTIGSLQDVSSSVSGTTNSDVVLFKSANSNTWTTKPLSEIGGGSSGGSVSGDYLPLSGGQMTGDIGIPLTPGTRDIGVPAAGSYDYNTSSFKNLPTHRSFIGTAYNTSTGKWWNIISCRHRNGKDDGSQYGMYITTNLTDTVSDLQWARQHSDGWQEERTILDDVNYRSLIYTWRFVYIGINAIGFNRNTDVGGRLNTSYNGWQWHVDTSSSKFCCFTEGVNSGTKFTIDTGGNGLFYGGITMYSDQRKKTILNHVELSLKQIADAPLIQHYYNSDQNKTTHVGSIAQYWAGLNDWFCKLDSEGYYTMEIQNAALASAISIARHLEKYESKTDKKIRMLKKRITELEDKLEKLEGGNYGC